MGQEISELTRWPLAATLAEDFPRWLQRFDDDGPFTKPGQLDWHRKTIDRRLKLGSVRTALADGDFMRALYETLLAWGLGTRASRLKAFEGVSDALRRHEEAISSFEHLSIDDPGLKLREATEGLWRLIEDLALVENDATLVSGTKALHHLLPDLVVPMDRAYTQVFFGWHNPQFQYGQAKCFAEAFEAFVVIARFVHPAEYVGSGWRSSRTKVLDNAVVAVVQALRSEVRSRTAG